MDITQTYELSSFEEFLTFLGQPKIKRKRTTRHLLGLKTRAILSADNITSHLNTDNGYTTRQRYTKEYINSHKISHSGHSLRTLEVFSDDDFEFIICSRLNKNLERGQFVTFVDADIIILLRYLTDRRNVGGQDLLKDWGEWIKDFDWKNLTLAQKTQVLGEVEKRCATTLCQIRTKRFDDGSRSEYYGCNMTRNGRCRVNCTIPILLKSPDSHMIQFHHIARFCNSHPPGVDHNGQVTPNKRSRSSNTIVIPLPTLALPNGTSALQWPYEQLQLGSLSPSNGALNWGSKSDTTVVGTSTPKEQPQSTSPSGVELGQNLNTSKLMEEFTTLINNANRQGASDESNTGLIITASDDESSLLSIKKERYNQKCMLIAGVNVVSSISRSTLCHIQSNVFKEQIDPTLLSYTAADGLPDVRSISGIRDDSLIRFVILDLETLLNAQSSSFVYTEPPQKRGKYSGNTVDDDPVKFATSVMSETVAVYTQVTQWLKALRRRFDQLQEVCLLTHPGLGGESHMIEYLMKSCPCLKLASHEVNELSETQIIGICQAVYGRHTRRQSSERCTNGFFQNGVVDFFDNPE